MLAADLFTLPARSWLSSATREMQRIASLRKPHPVTLTIAQSHRSVHCRSRFATTCRTSAKPIAEAVLPALAAAQPLARCTTNCGRSAAGPFSWRTVYLRVTQPRSGCGSGT